MVSVPKRDREIPIRVGIEIFTGRNRDGIEIEKLDRIGIPSVFTFSVVKNSLVIFLNS
jgi:hypothetical protein